MARTGVDIRGLALGGICLALAAALVVLSRDLTAIPGQQYGADTLPKVVAAVAALIGLWMILAAWRGGDEPAAASPEPASAAPRDPHWARHPSSWLRLGAAVALVLVYMVLSPPLGFLPAALISVLGMLLLMGVRPLTALLVAVPAVIAMRYAFADLLLVPLPRSPFLGGW